MDLQSEASSETRILVARHISAEKALTEPNHAVNTTNLCHSYSLQPDFGTYVEALQVYGWVLWSFALLAVAVTCAFYAYNLRSAYRHWKCTGALNASVVLAVYPVVSLAAFIALLVPRAQVLSEAVSQQTVMIALYHFYMLIIHESGGPEQLVRRSEGSLLETRVLPCCCWPCCVIPQPKLQPRHLKKIRYLLLQVPIVQGIIYVFILVLRAEDVRVYLDNFAYFQPFVAGSILPAIWGMMMCLKAVESTGARPRPRFIALQLVLVIVKVQCGIAKTLPKMVELPCLCDSLNPSVIVDLIHNAATILEMLMLSIWAWYLYKEPPGKFLDKEQNIMPTE